MSPPNQATLARMKVGQSGIVIEVSGGHGLVRRLHALDIRPGKKVTKVSSMFGHGPVTISIDQTQIALGYGMADKIIVDLDVK